MNLLERFQDGEQTLLIDQRGKRHLILLRKGETFHSDRGWIKHDDIIGRPELMRYATRKGMSRPALMRFALKLLANLSEPRGGDASDRVISAMTRLAPNPR